jgi:hypothetical protein
MNKYRILGQQTHTQLPLLITQIIFQIHTYHKTKNMIINKFK